MEKGNVFLRTVLSTVVTALGVAVPASAEEEPEVERDTVLLDPLYFIEDEAIVTVESENQRLWNELMKYKLWATDTIFFNKQAFRIDEPSGYTGTANGKVIFNNGGHTLGGPIIAGGDLQFSFPGMGANQDSLLKGPVRAGWLILPGWYAAQEVKYEGIYCFERQVYFEQPNRHVDPNDPNGATASLKNASTVVNRFIENVHKSGGKIYADWDKDYTDPALGLFEGLPDLNLDGSFAECPEDVPQPEKKLSVPVIDVDKINWGPALDLTISKPDTLYVQIPPISKADLEQSPKKVWYDKFVEDIRVASSIGKVIYILMPSAKQNANGKTGRLTRIFSKDGFHFENSANDMRIQVVYVNSDATWNDGTSSWDNLKKDEMTVVADSNYAGNLLFYTPADVQWDPFKASTGEAGDGAHFQGSFITAGNFKIYDHLSIAGQLIAGKDLWFESEFNGEFHYVPFNSPEIKTDVFSKDAFKENSKVWYDMQFYLTDTAHTEVSFDYCFAFFGIDADTTGGKYDAWKSETGTFAEPADLGENDGDHTMPFCKDGESKHIVIRKGQRHPDVPEYSAWLKVIDDDKVEGDEYMMFKIMNLNGAVISGNKFDGGLLVKLVDSNNKPPHFVNPEKTKLSIPENSVGAKAGVISAKDEEGDEYVYSITGGTAKDLFEIKSDGTVKMKAETAPFDYESWVVSGKKLTIDVELCDVKAATFSLMLCAEQRFTIDVTDVNETPYFNYESDVEPTIRIAEDAVLSIDKVQYSDYDTQSTESTFTNDEVVAIGGDTDVFDVTPKGFVTVKKDVVLDYEVKNKYVLEIQVRDANKSSGGSLLYPELHEEMTITILVTDVNDGPEFEYATYNGTVDENSVAGTEVKMDAAIYATSTQVGAVITYTLLDESKSFVIDPSTGVITVAKDAVLDYETKNVYEMKVVASDEDKTKPTQVVQTDTSIVIIKINDLNEKPIFVEPTKTLTFPENEKGYVIGTLAFDDYDTAAAFRNDKFECAECEEMGFYLDPKTGELTTTRKFDYETEAKTYELNVVVYDASGNKDLTASGIVTVQLTNVNEPPYLTETVFTVPENETIGTALKDILEATDIDGPDIVFNFHVLDGTKEVSATKEFKVDPKTGVITVASALDYETTDSYSIRIRVRDEHDGYSDTTITINVVDVNEAPSVTVDTIYVYENQKVNEVFSSVKTDKDDPDVKNENFRNNVYENTDDNKFFRVEPNGDVVLLQPVDYESDSLYSIVVRVTDKDDSELTSTKKVIVKVKDVFEQSVVEITRVETPDSIYIRPDTVWVNVPVVDIEWKQDDKTKSSTDSLKPGVNVIVKEYKDPSKNAAGRDSVVIVYSDATPIVTVTANGDNVEAENIYTVVEKATKNDTAIYVNNVKNDIKVTVKDSAANVEKSFTVSLSLDTVSVSSKEFKNMTKVADAKIAREKKPSSGITTVHENTDTYKNTYTETVNGIDVTVTYYTDKKGNDIKRSVITSSGKTKEIAVIEVSYTTKVNGKDVTISYLADASTGERVTLNTGLYDSESVLSADGNDVVGSYKVSYQYVDKKGNVVDVSYYLDEKGNIAKNEEGNIGYNVGYTYVNKFGNASRKEVFIVLDQVGPVVKIESPVEDAVLTANFTPVKWTVNGVVQDTLNVQGLEKGVNSIVRVFRDKAGNEASDTVHVMVKRAKDIDINVEKPVTLVDRDSIEKYYKDYPLKKNQDYSVTFYNYQTNKEAEALVGIKGKAKEGSGDEPYSGFDGGHLGPTLVVDARVPVVNALGGLATLDDIVSAGGMVALEGVDAANGKKISVSDYVDKYCTDEFKNAMNSDYSHMNLYWTTLKVNIWVYSNTGTFADHFSFSYKLDDPDYVNEAGFLKFYFEMKPDENGDLRTKDGRLYGTGAYLFKTEVKMSSKLRCTLPPISEDRADLKKNAVIKSSDELLKPFGYRRPVNK